MGWTADPESEIIAGELAASLVNVTLPVTLAAAAGVKVTFSVAVWPAATI